jgi:carboxyl-terminal processing protease
MKIVHIAMVVLLFPLTLMTTIVGARSDEVTDEAVRIISEHHLLRPDPKSLTQDTRGTLLASLQRIDPAAQWWSTEVATANREWTGTEIVGIGASVIDDGQRILFIPLPGGPLTRSGIIRPVRLLALAGFPVTRLDLEHVQQMVGDPTHDPIEVDVQDLATGNVIHLLLKRSSYNAVSAERIEVRGKTVLRIHRFVKGLTLRQFRAALTLVVAEARPLVLDLRYSAGGDLFEALNVASLFVEPGMKLATLEDASGRSTEIKSVGSGPIVTRQTTILVGPATVSASEVFAAALRDKAKASLIGTPTFGKCLVQSAFRLVDGSVLVISTGRVLTSSGWYCNGKGLLPDIQVGQAEDDDTDTLISRFIQ